MPMTSIAIVFAIGLGWATAQAWTQPGAVSATC